MSRESIQQFFHQLAQDDALKADLTEFAAQHGFEFAADELSNEQLEAIAGGLTNPVGGSNAGSGGVPPVMQGIGGGPIPIPYPNPPGQGSGGGAGTVKVTGKDVDLGSPPDDSDPGIGNA